MTRAVTVTSHSESPGVGTRVVDSADYLARYTGLSAGGSLVLGQDVDAVTGATVSSTAVIEAVNAAIEAYNQIP